MFLSDLDSDALKAFMAYKACLEEMDDEDDDMAALEIAEEEEDPTNICYGIQNYDQHNPQVSINTLINMHQGKITLS